MTRFIPMPWDESRAERWTARELALAQRLERDGLNFAEIADRLAEAGYPARDDTAIQHQLRQYKNQ